MGQLLDELTRRALNRFIDIAAERFASALVESVVPLFNVSSDGRPIRSGSGILLLVNSTPVLVTAGHSLRDFEKRAVHLPSARGKLLPVHGTTRFVTPDADSRDLGALLPSAVELENIGRHRFLAGSSDAEEVEPPPGDRVFGDYAVLGYSVGRSQSRIDRTEMHITETLFQCACPPCQLRAYDELGLSHGSHLLLDYDPKEIASAGRLETPPQLMGVSGGGVFRYNRLSATGRLAAILIGYRKKTKSIVCTRLATAMAWMRERMMTG